MAKMPTIPGYVIKRRIGKGGMGAVYLAEQMSLGRRVAMKVMLASLVEQDEQFAERFKREAQTTASLRHPNIITVYDSGEYGGRCYMAMDYIEGGSLRELMRTSRLSHRQTFRICAGIAAGLAKAHYSGFVHRDIKPENILLELTGNPVITDFGIVKVTYSTTELTGTRTVGSPTYMSPEQLMGDADLDGRADLYSLGVVLFEMLEGKPPFQSDAAYAVGMKHLNEDPPAVSEENGVFAPIVARLLEKSPDRRFESAGELIGALREIRDDVARGIRPTRPVPVTATGASADDVDTVVKGRSTDDEDTAVRTPVRDRSVAPTRKIAQRDETPPPEPAPRNVGPRVTRKVLSEAAPVADRRPTGRVPTLIGRLFGAWPVKVLLVLALAWGLLPLVIPGFSINTLSLELRGFIGEAAERKRIADRFLALGNRERARYWLEAAADDGVPGASYELGLSYRGEDEVRAIRAFEAERRGLVDDSWDLPADLMLAETLCNDRGIEDCARAGSVLERVVQQHGDARAMLKLGEIYMDRMEPPDFGQAVVWLKRAVEAEGSEIPASAEATEAMLRLAHLYENGNGVDPDPRESVRWLALAAQSPVARSANVREAKRRCNTLEAPPDACAALSP